jgi:acetoin utilization protein AcuB
MIPEIQSVMTLVPHSIGPDQTLKTAKEMMAKHNIRHLPVCEAGRIQGVISERDIYNALAIDKDFDYKLKVSDICLPDPYLVTPTTALDAVVTEMADKHYGSAVVVANDKPVGIFTAVDACRTLGMLLRGDKIG